MYVIEYSHEGNHWHLIDIVPSECEAIESTNYHAARYNRLSWRYRIGNEITEKYQ